MSRTPEVSVVIPTRGRAELLRDTLGALLRQRFDPERMEVVVVADGGDPATLAVVEEVARRAPFRVEGAAQSQSGPGAARNRGIGQASGRIVLMLDDDVVAVPDLVAEHARHHAGREDRVVTGALPVERTEGEPAHHRALRRWWEGVLEEQALPGHRPTFRDFVTGNVSAPRRRLLEVEGFDPAFVGYGREDYELGYRLWRAGLQFVHEPRAVAVHRYRKEPLDWLRQFRDQGRADVIFARRHPEIAGEIMTLSRFPIVPWIPATVALGERLVLLLNGRGGGAWRWAAGLTQAAYYWRGVREEAGSAAEFRRLVGAHAEGRRRSGHVGVADRLLIARTRWAS